MAIRILAASLLLATAGAASAADININCSVESGYELSVTERSVIYTRNEGVPKRVLMREGRLFVDDAWVDLSAEDSKRVASYERELRGMLPEFQRVARAATDIAFTALNEVADTLSGRPEHTRKTLASVRAKLDVTLRRSIGANHFNSDAIGDEIGKAVEAAMPELVGDVVGGVLRAALSGDEARNARMANLDERLDAQIAAQSKGLERDAQALCTRMEGLDRIENALQYRTRDGKPLELLRIDRSEPANTGKTVALR